MNSLSLKINVQNNSLVPTIEQKEQIHAFLFEKSSCYVTFAKEKKPRSNQESRYYWGVIVAMIAEETGYTDEEVHEFLKTKFLKKEMLIGRDHLAIGVSTATLTTVEFEKYCSEVRQWASAELSLYIPLPSEYV